MPDLQERSIKIQKALNEGFFFGNKTVEKGHGKPMPPWMMDGPDSLSIYWGQLSKSTNKRPLAKSILRAVAIPYGSLAWAHADPTGRVGYIASINQPQSPAFFSRPFKKPMESNLGERQESAWKDGSLYLALGGWTVILSAVTSFLFAILPLKLGQPGWQLNAMSTLFGASANILIGSLLILTARLFNPQDAQLKKNAALIRKLAGLIAVLMLVLIPFSLYAGSRAIRANETEGKIAIKQWKKQLAAVEKLSSEADIRRYAASLPDAPQLPAVFEVPFPIIKKRMMNNITGQINTVQNQVEENFRGQWLGFLKDFSRNSIQALLMAMAFSALSGEGFVPKFFLPIARNLLGIGPDGKN